MEPRALTFWAELDSQPVVDFVVLKHYIFQADVKFATFLTPPPD